MSYVNMEYTSQQVYNNKFIKTSVLLISFELSVR